MRDVLDAIRFHTLGHPGLARIGLGKGRLREPVWIVLVLGHVSLLCLV